MISSQRSLCLPRGLFLALGFLWNIYFSSSTRGLPIPAYSFLPRSQYLAILTNPLPNYVFLHYNVSWSKYGPYIFRNTFHSNMRNVSSVFLSSKHCYLYIAISYIIVMYSWIFCMFWEEWCSNMHRNTYCPNCFLCRISTW